MKRWKLTIEYHGADFCGWQRQPDAPSVQKTLELAIESFSGESVTLHAAGRTDAGVHARAQTAHFDLAKETAAETIRDALNFYLRPNRIAVLDVEQVSDDFHARFNAIRRSYQYTIINRRAPLAIRADQAWHIMRPLDVDAMQAAADLLIGTHDFSTFRAQNCQAKSPIKTLDVLTVTRRGEEIIFYTAARSFLYHQVRNMVGTLHFVGSGKWGLDEFHAAFNAHDRSRGGPTAPPQGLCFWEATYTSDPIN